LRNARRAERGISRERTPATPVVAVTGAARGIGLELCRRLAASSHVKRVIAIDDHRGDLAGVTWRVADVRDPAVAARLEGVDVLVHADLDLSPDTPTAKRRAFNVRGAQAVLTAAAAERVARVVLITSAMVYGARQDNPVPLVENARVSPDSDESVAGDMLQIEQLAVRARRAGSGTQVTVIRPAALVGEGMDTLVTRHFESPRLLKVRGLQSSWQFCHLEDLVSALELAVRGVVSGNVAVGCEGWLEQRQVEALSGLKSVELPARLTLATAQRLHRMGLTPASAGELRYLVYPWVVDCATLREAGWTPAYDNAIALETLLAQRGGKHAVAGRRLARKDAAITAGAAAGATAAVIGTAVVIRRARRRSG
jgi:nucleoside-diphosphate-sugar epimerase